MKDLVIMMLMAVIGLIGLTGCISENGWFDPVAGDVKTDQEYQQLPEAEQARYKPVTIEYIDPEIAGQVDEGLAAGGQVIEVTKHFIPEPFATGVVGLLGAKGFGWRLIMEKRVKDLLGRVRLGALITANTVEKEVRPVKEVMNEFKAEQKAACKNTNAIMPDEIATTKAA